MTTKIEMRQIDILSILSYYWLPLTLVMCGTIIVLTGIIEPIVWGFYLIIGGGVMAFAWTAFRRIF